MDQIGVLFHAFYCNIGRAEKSVNRYMINIVISKTIISGFHCSSVKLAQTTIRTEQLNWTLHIDCGLVLSLSMVNTDEQLSTQVILLLWSPNAFLPLIIL